jgi:hypothetical protein
MQTTTSLTMRALIFTSLACLLLGCNRGLPLPAPQVSIDPVLQPYVNDFVADAASVGRTIDINNLIVQFAPDLGNSSLGETVGECKIQYYNGNVYGTPTILIDRPFFEGTDAWSRHTVMYHEMGHCVLFRVHRLDWISLYGPDLFQHSIASSIMYPYVVASADAQMFSNYYVSEMFQ